MGGSTGNHPFFCSILYTRRMILRIASLFLAIIAFYQTSSQSIDDALRYSIFQYTSTARSAGVAGAFSALGADLSVANINPAGTAEFRKSEYTISLGVGLTDHETSFGANRISTTTSNVKVDNVAIVFFHDPASFDIKSFNLSFGINRLADFNQDIRYSGSSPGTIVERFLEVSEGFTPDELDNFEGGPAFDAGAIFDVGPSTYNSDFSTFNEVVFREERIDRTGSLQEAFLNISSNIKNKISLGFTLGVPILTFNEIKIYTESDPESNVETFDNLAYEQVLSTTAVGVNIKFGLIYKITRKFRFGAAVHSPSWYFLKDEFGTILDYTLTSFNTGAPVTESFSAVSPLSQFDYRMKSPLRILGGFSHLFKRGDLLGFISGEAEYVDYSTSSFNLTSNSNNPFDQFIEDDLNDEISLLLTAAVNIRLGGEIAYKKYRFRLGAALLGSPYKNSDRYSFNPQFNTGIGYRGDIRYVDLALTLGSRDTRYSPYRLIDVGRQPVVFNSFTRMRISLTFGSKI